MVPSLEYGGQTPALSTIEESPIPVNATHSRMDEETTTARIGCEQARSAGEDPHKGRRASAAAQEWRVAYAVLTDIRCGLKAFVHLKEIDIKDRLCLLVA
jgi:hypothetical protein